MKSFTPLGIVGIDENGRYHWIPFEVEPVSQVDEPVASEEHSGGIVTPPNPEQERISKEKEFDPSLTSVLKKNKSEE